MGATTSKTPPPPCVNHKNLRAGQLVRGSCFAARYGVILARSEESNSFAGEVSPMGHDSTACLRPTCREQPVFFFLVMITYRSASSSPPPAAGWFPK